MSIFTWIAKPIIREVVKQAMNEFFKNHWTHFLSGLIVLFVGIAWLMGKEGVDINSFLVASGIGIGGNVLRSGTHAVAGAIAVKNNHAQGVTNAPSNGNGL